MTPDPNGIPGKAFLAVVQGGVETTVGQKIWDTKPAGIQSYGLIDVPVKDSVGDTHHVFFSRPDPISIFVEVKYTLDPEGVFPVGGEEAIKEAVVLSGNTLGIGEDVIAQKFFGPIYSTVSGIGNMVITVGTEQPVVAPKVSIAADDYSVFSEATVSVIAQ